MSAKKSAHRSGRLIHDKLAADRTRSISVRPLHVGRAHDTHDRVVEMGDDRYNARMHDPQTSLLRQLSDSSSPYRDPVPQIDWAQLDTESYWLPECALSLYGLPQYDALPVVTRRKLSQYELLNIIHCALWLEGIFLRRLTRNLDFTMPRTEYEYVLHELREEAGHSLMFLKLIEASGLLLPHRVWRPPRFADALGRWLPASGELFWLAMLIGEDGPDRLNRWLREQGNEVHPAVRGICTLHMIDEARHIAFARKRLEQLLRDTGVIGRKVLAGASKVLVVQLARALYFPPAPFYELAGLPGGVHWRRLALQNPARQRFVAARLAPTLRLLESYGLCKARTEPVSESSAR